MECYPYTHLQIGQVLQTEKVDTVFLIHCKINGLSRRGLWPAAAEMRRFFSAGRHATATHLRVLLPEGLHGLRRNCWATSMGAITETECF